MKSFEDFSKSDYDKIAKDIISLSKKDENQLFQVMGHALNDMGLKASENKDLFFERADKGTNGISALKGFNYVSNTEALDQDQAQRRGKIFWNKFSSKIQKIICENQAIIDIINGKGDLKDKLAIAIPAILALIGGGIILGPVYITIISIALAIIIRAGLGAYCEIN